MVKVFQMPSDTESQRDALVNPPNGTMLFNSDTGNIDYTADMALTWRSLSSSANSSPPTIVYVSNSGNDFTGTGKISSPFLTLTKARVSITDASSSKPYIIFAAPGVYNELDFKFKPWIYYEFGNAAQLVVTNQVTIDDAYIGGSGECGMFNCPSFTPNGGYYTPFSDVSGPSSMVMDNVYSTIPVTYNVDGSLSQNSISTFNNVSKNPLTSDYPSINVNVSNLEVYNSQLQNIGSEFTLLGSSGTREVFIENVNVINQLILGNEDITGQTFNLTVKNAICGELIIEGSNTGIISANVDNLTSPTFQVNQLDSSSVSVDLGLFTGSIVKIGTPTITYNGSCYVGTLTSTQDLNIENNTNISIISDTADVNISSNAAGINVTSTTDLVMVSSSGNVGIGSTTAATDINSQTDIDLTSAAGNINLSAQAALSTLSLNTGASINCPDDINITSTGDIVSNNGSINLQTTGINISDINLTAVRDINLTTNSNNMTFNAAKTIALTSSSTDINLTASNGNMSLSAQGGLSSLSLSNGAGFSSDSDMDIGSGAGNTIIGAWTDIALNTTNGILNVNAQNGVQMASSTATNWLFAPGGQGTIGLGPSGIGFFTQSGGPVAQGAPIADATNSVDVITQLNLLLAYLRSRGDIGT